MLLVWKLEKNCDMCGDCFPLHLQTAVPCLNTDFSVCITILACSDIVTCEYYLCLAFLLPVQGDTRESDGFQKKITQ